MRGEWALGTLQLLAILQGLCRGMSESGHDVTATCNTNTKRKMKLKSYRTKSISSRERAGELDSGLLGTHLLTIDYYQGAVKIE